MSVLKYVKVILVATVLPILGVPVARTGRIEHSMGDKVHKLPKSIGDKPVAVDPQGESVTLRDAVKLRQQQKRSRLGEEDGPAPELRWLSDLDGARCKRLVIQRLRMDPAREVWVFDKGVFTIDQVIEAVRQGTEIGQLFIRMEKSHIAELKEKIEAGEYEVE